MVLMLLSDKQFFGLLGYRVVRLGLFVFGIIRVRV